MMVATESGFQAVRSNAFDRGFMAFRAIRRTRIVMLMVLA
jgi:hypothetical protein